MGVCTILPAPSGRYEQGGFIAQRRRKQAEGRDFRGGIHPDQFVAERNSGDHVIELGRRGNVGIDLA